MEVIGLSGRAGWWRLRRRGQQPPDRAGHPGGVNARPGTTGAALRQPVSGPMDLLTALWFVDYTAGQFRAFQRDGRWYLCLSSDPAPTGTTVDGAG